jgi:hypothetical protein
MLVWSVVVALLMFSISAGFAAVDAWRYATSFALGGVALGITFARSGAGELRVTATEIVLRTAYSDAAVAVRDVARIGLSHRGNVLLLFSREGGVAAVALDLADRGSSDLTRLRPAQLRRVLPGALASRVEHTPIEWRRSASIVRSGDLRIRVLRPSRMDVAIVLTALVSLSLGAVFRGEGLTFDGVALVLVQVVGIAYAGFQTWLVLRLRDSTARRDYFKQLDAYAAERYVGPGVRGWVTRGFYVVNVAMAAFALAMVIFPFAVRPAASGAWIAALAVCGIVGATALLASVVVAAARRPRTWVPEPFRRR